MFLTFSIKDLADFILCNGDFKTALNNAVEEKTMALRQDLEVLKAKLAEQGVAVGKEFEEVKAKFLALKSEIGTLTTAVNDLTAKVEELEGIDLSVEIGAINDSLAVIDSISESDAPVPTPEPTPEGV